MGNHRHALIIQKYEVGNVWEIKDTHREQRQAPFIIKVLKQQPIALPNERY